MLANANKTYYGAMGHNKASMNGDRIKAIEDELLSRNVVIPDCEELLKKGVFNGEGAV